MRPAGAGSRGVSAATSRGRAISGDVRAERQRTRARGGAPALLGLALAMVALGGGSGGCDEGPDTPCFPMDALEGPGDIDVDAVCDDVDNCPQANPDQADQDHDGIGDACDLCPAVASGEMPWAVRSGKFFTQSDVDLDGVGDPCDPDADGDALDNAADPCPFDNGNDSDGDGVCNTTLYAEQVAGGTCNGSRPVWTPGAACDPIRCCGDNCPSTSNADQRNTDGDACGDACESECG